jgi:dihydropteroate synthase
MIWKTSRRKLSLERPLVMGILNVTPDSFSDGGSFDSIDTALKHAEQMITEGADVIDIGGESTRPGSVRITVEEEISRVVPVITAMSESFDIPLSVDTSKSEVAEAAVVAGAEIINDISALRFDERLADAASRYKTGLILMHSRGDFETMHSQPPVENISDHVANDFRRSTALAGKAGVEPEQIVLDVGIGFGKTPEQNLELIAKLDKLVGEFETFPLLVGTSRKSFIGKLLGDAPTDERLPGSLATAAIAIWNGAKIVRVHDVKETVQLVRTIVSLRSALT